MRRPGPPGCRTARGGPTGVRGGRPRRWSRRCWRCGRRTRSGGRASCACCWPGKGWKRCRPRPPSRRSCGGTARWIRPRGPASRGPSRPSSTRIPTRCGRWTSRPRCPAGRAAVIRSPSSTTIRATRSPCRPVPTSAPPRCAPIWWRPSSALGCPIGSWSTTAVPGAIGPPIATPPLTVWLRRLGVAVSHSRPYHPQTLGKDERFHGTLQRELLAQPPRPDLDAWHAAFAAWRQRYNHVRPHQNLARRRARQPLHPQPAALPRPAAAPALRPGRSGPPHRHRRLLGRGLHDRAPAHPRSA